jgi:hypothetical protein
MCTCRVQLLFSFRCYRTRMSLFCLSLPAYVRSQLYDDNNVLEATHSRTQTETTVNSNASKRPHAFVIVDANGNENDEKREFIAADSVDQYTIRADDWSPSESELTASRLTMPIGIVDITSMRLRENDPLCLKYLQFTQVCLQSFEIQFIFILVSRACRHAAYDDRSRDSSVTSAAITSVYRCTNEFSRTTHTTTACRNTLICVFDDVDQYSRSIRSAVMLLVPIYLLSGATAIK